MTKNVKNIKYDWDSNKISATGGFPPIYKVNKEEIIIIEKNKNREFKSNTEAISIKNIMTQRKEIEPFI